MSMTSSLICVKPWTIYKGNCHDGADILGLIKQSPLEVLMSVNKKRGFVSLLVAATVLLPAGVAGATQLPNQNGALACKEVKLSSTSKVQACTDVSSYGTGSVYVGGIADATAYKKVKLD